MKSQVNTESLSFLIPAFNDEETIAKAISEAVAVGKSLKVRFDILVINDASTDETGRILEKLKRKIPMLIVRHHTDNGGYGATIRELYEWAQTTWMFSVPGDYQIGATELLKLWPLRTSYQLLIGWRQARNDPPARRLQSWVYNHLLKLMFHLPIADVNSVRLMKRAAFAKIRLTTVSAFVDAELVLNFFAKKLAVCEVPIEHRARVESQGGGGGKFGTIWPVVRDMVKTYAHSISVS
jgi:glycosyltransferase involved in cell wall biosynthesis